MRTNTDPTEKMNKAGLKMFSFLILAFFATNILNCNMKEKEYKWDSAAINTNISKNPVYKTLDTKAEFFTPFEKNDTLKKKTSDVAYTPFGKEHLKDDFSKTNKCKVFLIRTH